jgi:uncharacterized membrane protein YgcG
MRKKIDPQKMLRDAGHHPVDERFLKSLRADLVNYVKLNPATHESPHTPFPRSAASWFRQVRFVPAVGALSIFLLVGTVLAATKSLPGSILYSVKLTAENVRAAAVFGMRENANLRLSFVRERLQEIETVLQRTKAAGSTLPASEVLGQALDNLAANSSRVSDYVTKLKATGDLNAALEVSRNLNDSVSTFTPRLPENKEPIRPDEARISRVIEDIKKNAEKEVNDMQPGINPDAQSIAPSTRNDANKETGSGTRREGAPTQAPEVPPASKKDEQGGSSGDSGKHSPKRGEEGRDMKTTASSSTLQTIPGHAAALQPDFRDGISGSSGTARGISAASSSGTFVQSSSSKDIRIETEDRKSSGNSGGESSGGAGTAGSLLVPGQAGAFASSTSSENKGSGNSDKKDGSSGGGSGRSGGGR